MKNEHDKQNTVIIEIGGNLLWAILLGGFWGAAMFAAIAASG